MARFQSFCRGTSPITVSRPKTVPGGTATLRLPHPHDFVSPQKRELTAAVFVSPHSQRQSMARRPSGSRVSSITVNRPKAVPGGTSRMLPQPQDFVVPLKRELVETLLVVPHPHRHNIARRPSASLVSSITVRWPKTVPGGTSILAGMSDLPLA